MMNVQSRGFKTIMVVLLLLACSSGLLAQTRLVLNGGLITLNQGVYLVVDNPASNAITRNSGYIISEGENSRVWWNIGTTVGTYTVPWGYSTTDYIPLIFTKTAGTGSGRFLFSTYHTGWQNSTQLPTGVANMNGSTGSDNSAFVADRFWQINAAGYTTKPTLSNLVFTYIDDEHTAANNTITESRLVAKRYNSALSSWTDNIPTSTVNATNNTVTVTAVDIANLQPWWVLGTNGGTRYWVAPSASSSNLSANWSETAGGAGNAGAPTASDVVIFDGTSDANCLLNAALSAYSLVVNSGYNGTITQGANAITLGSDAVFSGGTFAGGLSDISVSGSVVLNGTAFTSTATTFDVKGNWALSGGSFSHNNGTILFSGNTTQTVGGGVTGNFNNLVVTNTSSPGVNLAGNQNLGGMLTLAENVTFDADGTDNTAVFTLLSTGDSPTHDAAIAALPVGAQVSGDVTVQRYMSKEGPNNTRIYRYIASPVQNATAADLQTEIPVTGSFTGTSVCQGCGTTQSMFSYQESVTTDTNGNGLADMSDGYQDFPAISNDELMEPGRGYSVFVRGNLLATARWDVRGPVNAGTIALPVSFTSSGTVNNDGWSLVGNPFPSTIDWNAASGWTKSNMSGSIYMTDNGNAATQYASWNGVTGTNGGTRYIALGQAFWVKATGAGTPVLTLNENVKVGGQQTTFFRENDLADLLRVTLVSGTTRDEAVIHFRPDATDGFDAHADAVKFQNSTFNLSSMQPDGLKLSINSLSGIHCGTEVKLAVENSKAGNYRFDFGSQESFPAHLSIVLEDDFTKGHFDVRSGSGTYAFAVTSNSASYGPNRFKLIFKREALDAGFIANAPDICEGAELAVQIERSQPGAEYVAMTESGLRSALLVGNGGTLNLFVPGDGLMAGENKVIVRSAWAGCAQEVKKEVTFVVEKKFTISAVRDSARCRAGIVTLRAQGAPHNGSYRWYEAGSDAPIEGQQGAVFTTPHLIKSKTYYVAAVNSQDCEGPRAPVQAEIRHYDDAMIRQSVSGDSLASNYIVGNRWYFNHVAIPGGTEQRIKLERPGTYSVEVNVAGCTTGADYGYAVTAAEKEVTRVIQVFPNPVVEGFTVSLPKAFVAIEGVRVINNLGVVIGTVTLKSRGETRVGNFDMTPFPRGVYILQLIGTTGNPGGEIKLIKE
jgi:hypothetical protein